MRVRALTMKPYGAFDERSVTLGTGLSLVIGLNEAGKSTALDALTDFLWGIPTVSSQTFLYGRPALTIRATIHADGSDGGSAALVRRSTGLSDEHTGGDAEPMWATETDTRGRWRDSFGLSHQTLRDGGKSLCRGEGDLAELVFAARSGKRVRDLFNDIQGRADDLYKPHRNNKGSRTRVAFTQFQEAAEREKNATANGAQVESARQRVEDAEADATRAEQRASRALSSLTGAQRRREAAPHARALADLRQDEQRIRDAGPVLMDEQIITRAEATKDIDSATDILASKTVELDEVTASRAIIVVDEDVLTDAATINTLNLAAAAELVRGGHAAELLEEAVQSDRDARAHLERLTGPTGKGIGELLADLNVPADRVTQLDVLAEKVATKSTVLQGKEDAERASAERLREADSPDTEVPAAAVPAVREAVSAIRADGAATSRQRDALATKADAQKRRDAALRKAGLPPDMNKPTVVPSEAAVADIVKRSRDAETEHRTAVKELADAHVALTTDEGRLSELRDAGVPDEQALQDARGERDTAVAEVFKGLEQGHVPDDVADVRAHISRTTAAADDVADGLRRDADAAAAREELRKRIAEHHTVIDDATRVTEHLAETVAAVEDEWKAIWHVFGEDTPTLDSGPVVRRDLVAAYEAHDEAEAAETMAASLNEQVAAQTDSLRRALAEAKRERAHFDLDALLETAEALTAEDDAARESRATRKQLTKQHDNAVAGRDTAADDFNDIRREWEKLLLTCDLPGDLDTAGWVERRDLLASARALHATAEKHSQQAGEEKQKYEEWAAGVARLTDRHGGPQTPLDAAIAILDERARGAENAQKEATRLDDEARKLEAVIEQQHAIVDGATERLQTLQKELNVDSLTTIDDAAQRTSELRSVALAADTKLELLRTAMHDPDADERIDALDDVLDAAVAEANTEHEEAKEELRSALDASADARQSHRNLLNANGGAELHALAREALTLTQENVEQYLVARIQAAILERELDEYERKNASPLLDEAGTILEQLTDGRWVALASRDLPTGRSLEIVAADETRHRPEELSEGTADQVYLALRLAGIASLQAAREAEGAPTLPVVFDDVLMTFDDTRATAALTVMAVLASRWQIIVFSHHRHLAELAAQRVPTAHISHLDPPTHMTATHTSTEIRQRAHQSRRTTTATSRKPKPHSDPALNGAIREWAREQGHLLGDRGRIPYPVIDEYHRAHSNTGE